MREIQIKLALRVFFMVAKSIVACTALKFANDTAVIPYPKIMIPEFKLACFF